MRIVVHDFVGYPFPAQLARGLARRGHVVLHLHCASFVAGKGLLERRAGDPEGLEFEGILLGRPFVKYDVLRRVAHETEAGQEIARRIARFAPDVVISADAPLFVQRAVLRCCAKQGAAFVFWQQDVISAAARKVLGRRFAPLGALAARVAGLLEGSLLRRSDAVVPISEDFVPLLRRWRVPPERIAVIENWAPVEELPTAARDNPWARENGLDGKTVFLYAGTLGYKHNPALLLELARWGARRGDVAVCVVSEGIGADWLARFRDDEPALRLQPYQPYERLPDVLGAADVLVVALERDAQTFSVPSKVLAYLCAGRPLLAALSSENLAARVIVRSGAGVVVAPDDPQAFITAASELADDPGLRRELGLAGRDYAEKSFRLDAIARRFEEICAAASARVTAYEI